MVPGDYSDEDGDGFLDACQDLVLVIHTKRARIYQSPMSERFTAALKRTSHQKRLMLVMG